jgi:amphiphysin
LDPLQQFTGIFPAVDEAIKRRQKKLLDYDSSRSKVRALAEKPSEDPEKLPRVIIDYISLNSDNQ